MISESGSVEAMLRSPGFPAFSAATLDHQRVRIFNKKIPLFIIKEVSTLKVSFSHRIFYAERIRSSVCRSNESIPISKSSFVIGLPF